MEECLQRESVGALLPEMTRLKRVYQSFLGATLSISLLLTIGYLTPTKWGRSTAQDCASKAPTIYVFGDLLHTNVIVPVQHQGVDWQSRLPLDAIGSDVSANYRYLGFGWGERNFYMNTPSPADIKLSSALKALFLFNPSVLYVQGLQEVPLQDPNVRCLKVSDSDYLKLVEFISATFQRNPQGDVIRLKDGYSPNAGFYAANGKYSIVRTCNSWTADGLRSANINTPLWAGLAPAIMFHLPKQCKCESDSHK